MRNIEIMYSNGYSIKIKDIPESQINELDKWLNDKSSTPFIFFDLKTNQKAYIYKYNLCYVLVYELQKWSF